MTPDSINFPQWMVTAVVVPIALGLMQLLWWIGKREVSHYDQAIDEMQAEIDRMRRERQNEHAQVEKKLDEIRELIREKA